MFTPEALSYHLKVRDYFKQQTKTWEYFSKNENKEEQLRQFKTELLKNTYKFDPQSESGLYTLLNQVKEKLDLSALPVTVYQAQHTEELNASIVYIPHEAHIVFSGPVIKLLDNEELMAVLAHELSHVKLFTIENAELEIADRVVTAIANNISSDPVYVETARLFKLYTEIYCDRGAFTVLGKTGPVISSLVKVSTGLESVNAASFIQQADEVFSRETNTVTTGISHPENFIRAKAISLWQEQGEKSEEQIIKMIEGVASLDKLDLFQQKKSEILTRRLLQLFLKPRWMQSNTVISLAKRFFSDFIIDDKAVLTDELLSTLEQSDQSLKDYYSYLLLDFTLADPALEEIPAGWAIRFSEATFLKDSFEPALRKELKLSEKKYKQYKEKSLAAYAQVHENEAEQIFED